MKKIIILVIMFAAKAFSSDYEFESYDYSASIQKYDKEKVFHCLRKLGESHYYENLKEAMKETDFTNRTNRIERLFTNLRALNKKVIEFDEGKNLLENALYYVDDLCTTFEIWRSLYT